MNINFKLFKLLILFFLLGFNSSILFAQKFEFLKEISGYTQSPKQFQIGGNAKLAIDKFDNIFISDMDQNCIIKLDNNKNFIKKWDKFDSKTMSFNGNNIKADKNGNIFMVDYFNDRILIFDNDGNPILSISNENIKEPIDIAIDSFNNLYVIVDATSKEDAKILKFDSKGKYLLTFNDKNYKPIELEAGTGRRIESIIIDNLNNIYVSYYGYHKILKFNTDGKFLNIFAPNVFFNHPSSISSDSKNNIFVTDETESKIFKISSEGNLLNTFFDENKIFYPSTIIVDSKNHFYTKWDGMTEFDSNGTFINNWGSNGSNNGQFNEPNSILVSEDNFLFVADNINFNIQKFDFNGNFVKEICQTRKLSGEPFFVNEITEDIRGNILLLNSTETPVICLDKRYNFSNSYSSMNTDASKIKFENARSLKLYKNQFWLSKYKHNAIEKVDYKNFSIKTPDSLANNLEIMDFVFDKNDNVIASFSNQTLQKFDIKGKFLGYVFKNDLNSDQELKFTCLKLNEKDELFACNGRDKILIFDKNFNIIQTIGELGKNPGQFNGVSKIALSKDGKMLFASDAYNKRIQIFKEK